MSKPLMTRYCTSGRIDGLPWMVPVVALVIVPDDGPEKSQGKACRRLAQNLCFVRLEIKAG
jgi:hypothetical protein